MTVLIDGFLIDAALSETHRRDSEVTEFPVESGSDLTDHIRQLPVELEIEGIVSNTPIGTVALLRDLDGGGGVLPVDEAIAHLERIWERRQLVTVQTSLKLYERMAMLKLEIPRDRKTGKALRFTTSFRQIRIITNQRTPIRVDPVGAGKRKLGTRPALSVPPGSTTVFTLRRLSPGQTGGFTAANGIAYKFRPAFLSGDPGRLVLTSKAGDHYAARAGEVADGFVLKGKYTPFKKPIQLASVGGVTLTDQTGRVWRSYPQQNILSGTDETLPERPDTGQSETNAQFMQRVYGITVPGL